MQLNRRETAITRWLAAGLCMCFMVTTSCTHMADVPPGTIDDVSVKEGSRYRIETTGGDVYVTDHLERTETAFVIHTLPRNPGTRRPQTFIVVEPIEVPFGDVSSMKRWEVSAGRTTLLAVSLIPVVAVIAAVAALQDFEF